MKTEIYTELLDNKHSAFASEAWTSAIEMEKSKSCWEMRTVQLKNSNDEALIQRILDTAKKTMDSLYEGQKKTVEGHNHIKKILSEKPAGIKARSKEASLWKSVQLSANKLNVVEDRFRNRIHLANGVYESLTAIKSQTLLSWIGSFFQTATSPLQEPPSSEEYRSKIVDLDGLKCEWEMRLALWKLFTPIDALVITTLGEAQQKYNELKDFHTNSTKLRESEKPDPALRALQERMGTRLAKAATALQSLYNFNSNPLTKSYHYILGLTPSVSTFSQDRFEEKYDDDA